MQPGIGDTVWCFHKLQDYLKSKGYFDVEVSSTGILRSETIMKLVGARRVGTHNANPTQVECKAIKSLAELRSGSYVSINKHLESGRRIEEWLPELKMKWDIEFNIPLDSRIKAIKLIPKDIKCPVGVYTSSLPNNMNPQYNGFGLKGWATRILEIMEHRPDSTIVLIGADYDRSILDPLAALLKEAEVPHILVIGEDISVTIEVIKKLKFLISYPSGIGILGNILHTPTLMYMPKWLTKMHNTWLHPDAIGRTAVHLQFNNHSETNNIIRNIQWKS